MARTFRPLEPLRGWRRLAVHSWRGPRDPTVYGVVDIEVSGALAYVDRVREATGARVTMTHMIARGLALAIRAFPQANGIVARRRILLRDTVDIFLQVATEGGRDLSGFKVPRTDEKSVIELSREVEERVERLRTKRDRQVERTKSILDRVPLLLLGPMMRTIAYLIYDLDLDLSRLGIVKDEFGSAMVSNIGTFGLTSALAPLVPFSRTPIVVLVGHVEARAIVVEGQVAARPMLTLGCTFDHRFLDGYQAGKMVDIIRAYMTDPEQYEGRLETKAPLVIGATTSR
jgi:pyruvate/2-oxoglutarate dehydrogenase complex dihydrolipoamide acyltransferase (E2) component